MLDPEYWDNDNLGVEPPRRCSKCRQCQEKGECSESHILHSLKDQAELDSIMNGITVKNGKTFSSWGFIKDPSCLSDNRDKVIATQARLYKNLLKEGILDKYNEQIQAGIDSGLWSEISQACIGCRGRLHEFWRAVSLVCVVVFPESLIT